MLLSYRHRNFNDRLGKQKMKIQEQCYRQGEFPHGARITPSD